MGGFETWNHSPAVYITDYLILIAGLAAASRVYNTRRGVRRERYVDRFGLVEQFQSYCVLTGLAYLFGGIAHHALASYEEAGHFPSRRWDHEHSFWMWSWLFSQILFPLASAALMATILAATLAERWGSPAIYAVGFLASLYEAFLVLSGDIDDSGMVSVVFGFAIVIGVAMIIGITYVSNRNVKTGMNYIAVGIAFQLAILVIVIATPEHCREGYQANRIGCLFPEEFSQSAVSHLLTIISLGFLAQGVSEIERTETYFDALDWSGNKRDRSCCGISS